MYTRYDIKKGLHLAFQALIIKHYIGWVEFSKLCKPCENYLERSLSGSLQQNLGESAKVLWKWSSFQIFPTLPWHLIIMAQSIPRVSIRHLSFCLGKAANAPWWGWAFIQKLLGTADKMTNARGLGGGHAWNWLIHYKKQIHRNYMYKNYRIYSGISRSRL